MGRYNSSLPQKLGDEGVLTQKSRLVRWQRTKPSTLGLFDTEKSGPGPQKEGVHIVHSDEVECGEESTMMDERRTRGSRVKVSEDVLCIVLCAGIT
jgi:hypothetical protein